MKISQKRRKRVWHVPTPSTAWGRGQCVASGEVRKVRGEENSFLFPMLRRELPGLTLSLDEFPQKGGRRSPGF
jgi:hypothetical protein